MDKKLTVEIKIKKSIKIKACRQKYKKVNKDWKKVNRFVTIAW